MFSYFSATSFASPAAAEILTNLDENGTMAHTTDHGTVAWILTYFVHLYAPPYLEYRATTEATVVVSVWFPFSNPKKSRRFHLLGDGHRSNQSIRQSVKPRGERLDRQQEAMFGLSENCVTGVTRRLRPLTIASISLKTKEKG